MPILNVFSPTLGQKKAATQTVAAFVKIDILIHTNSKRFNQMSSTIKEFWYGNITPHSDCRPQTPEFKKLTEYIIRHRNELIITMSDEQREVFEKLDMCWNEYINLTEEAIFSYAFKLGLNIATEALNKNF